MDFAVSIVNHQEIYSDNDSCYSSESGEEIGFHEHKVYEIDEDDEIDKEIEFEAEEDIESFLTAGEEVESGAFRPIINVDLEDEDWSINDTPGNISGDGITVGISTGLGQENEYDFLPSKGWKNARYTKLKSSTKLTLSDTYCEDWVENIFQKGWCTNEDLEWLVSACEGNGDYEELLYNLRIMIDQSGFNLFGQDDFELSQHFDLMSDIDPEDLKDSIQAALNRDTCLPGLRNFVIDVNSEIIKAQKIANANYDIFITIIESSDVLDELIESLEELDESLTSLNQYAQMSIISELSGQSDGLEFRASLHLLRQWYYAGKKVDGKERKKALNALTKLNLNKQYLRNITKSIDTSDCNSAFKFKEQLDYYESLINDLILEHLPFVRRFASRSSREDEDTEDVFQVSYMGFRKAIDRFDFTKGNRLIQYITVWMWQALGRWRANESSLIRVPAHRYEALKKIDDALNLFCEWDDNDVPDTQLAKETKLSAADVIQFRLIPRQAYFPDKIEEWDEIFNISIDESSPPYELDLLQNELEDKVSMLLSSLSPKEEKVLRLRFGIGMNSDSTLEEVGKHFKVTRERVRQIEKKALEKLRRLMIREEMNIG